MRYQKTLDELSKDKNFITDLRDGNFCLVVGAGFSYGLQNKLTQSEIAHPSDLSYDDFKNIPIASKFIEITNKFYNVKKPSYQSSADLWYNYGVPHS